MVLIDVLYITIAIYVVLIASCNNTTYTIGRVCNIDYITYSKKAGIQILPAVAIINLVSKIIKMGCMPVIT